MSDTITTSDMLNEILAGLGGVPDGDWRFDASNSGRPSSWCYQLVQAFGDDWVGPTPIYVAADRDGEGTKARVLARHLARCAPPSMRQIAADFAALEAENRRLREALDGLVNHYAERTGIGNNTLVASDEQHPWIAKAMIALTKKGESR